MGLRLEDRWIWDFWHVWDGLTCHLFYLQAPRALGDERHRHRNATIGHAVSTDLANWTVLPDALGAGPRGAWDDIATWTGSVVRDDSRWVMLYTGISSRDQGLVQRIGAAVSTDLIYWEKDDRNPLIEADARWYEKLGSGDWFDEAWRDPWIFHADGNWHALITARSLPLNRRQAPTGVAGSRAATPSAGRRSP